MMNSVEAAHDLGPFLAVGMVRILVRGGLALDPWWIVSALDHDRFFVANPRRPYR